MDGLAAFYAEVGEPDGGPRTLRALLWAMLGDEQLTPRHVGALIGPHEMQAAAAAVTDTLALCMPPRGPARADRTPIDWWRVWSFARLDLGLSDTDFWGLTPRQFCALTDRHRDAFDRLLTGHAMTCAVYANVHRDEEKRPQPFQPADFMPNWDASAKQTEDEKKLAEVKRLRAKMASLRGLLGAVEETVNPEEVRVLDTD